MHRQRRKRRREDEDYYRLQARFGANVTRGRRGLRRNALFNPSLLIDRREATCANEGGGTHDLRGRDFQHRRR